MTQPDGADDGIDHGTDDVEAADDVDLLASTSVPAVDDALALLAGLGARPVVEHVAVLDEVHRRLQDALATVDEA